MQTADLLSAYERCPRRGYYSQFWELHRLSATQMTSRAITQALGATALNGEASWGDLAGAEVMALAEDRGLDGMEYRIFDCVLHHAALADILTTVLRKQEDPAWLTPEPVQNWTPDCLMSPDGTKLRRIVLASSWSEERHYHECRSWYSLGNMAAYNLPMQMIVLIIGSTRDGHRRSPWTQGFLHPANHQLRFRKRNESNGSFTERWERVYREDHAEITKATWLNAMLADDLMPDLIKRVDQGLPAPIHLEKIRNMRDVKLEALGRLRWKPDGNLSTCDWPSPCPFRRCCHSIPESDPCERLGYRTVSAAVSFGSVSR